MRLISRFSLPFVGCYSVLLIFLSPLSASKGLPSKALSPLEQGILQEMNRVRANPQSYVKFLREWRKRFQGKQARLSPRLFLQTKEGTVAVDDAIRAMNRARPAPALSLSVGLSRAARDHVLYQGRRGLIGHTGKNGSTPFDRMNRYGRWLRVAGENISYGPDAATAVVRDLIVDDGVLDRSHRINLLRADYRIAGIACGAHQKYRTMCVIKYAGAYREQR